MRSAKLLMAIFTATAVVVLLGYGAANAETIYSNNWNTDPEGDFGGWTGTVDFSWLSDGGPDSSGCLKATRTASRYRSTIEASGAPVITAIGGDLASQYETITIDADIWTYDSYAANGNGLGWYIHDSEGGYWCINLAVPPNPADSTWNSYSKTIDTTWTDAEANTAGWVQWTSTKTWAELMANVTKWTFIGRAKDYKNTGNANYEVRLDNFVAEGVPVPEPGTLSLLGCGLVGLLAYAWRRRK